MTPSQLFVTPRYGEAMVRRLRYSRSLRIDDRVETSGQGGWHDEFNIPDALDAEIEQAFDKLSRGAVGEADRRPPG